MLKPNTEKDIWTEHKIDILNVGNDLSSNTILSLVWTIFGFKELNLSNRQSASIYEFLLAKHAFYIFEFRLNELNPFTLFVKYLSLRSIQSYSYSASSILSTQQQKNKKKIFRFYCIYTKCIIFYSYELFAYSPKNNIL